MRPKATSILLLALLVLFFLPTVNAQTQPNAFITFIDVIDKQIIDNVFVNVIIGQEHKTYFVAKDENLKLALSQETIRFELNDPLTPGYDYHAQATFDNQTILITYAHPVGSIHGTVVDKLGNVIANVPLKFECTDIGITTFPQTTDDFGSFTLSLAPVGSCTITATYDEAIGTQTIQIQQGQKEQVTIPLDKILVEPKPNYSVLLLPIGTVLSILFLAVYLLWKKRKTQFLSDKSASKSPKQHSLKPQRSSATQDPPSITIPTTTPNQYTKASLKIILPTLRENERKIVEFLLQEKAQVHLSKIHLKTGISKGALFRNIASLEQKKIIETVMEGRIRKIKLAPAYLS